MEGFDRKTNDVDITITVASDNEIEISESSDEDEEVEKDASQDDDLRTERAENNDKDDDQNVKSVQDEDEKELCDGLENGLSLSEEKPAPEEKEGSEEYSEQLAYEIVGDRILVEKDGKFELVDVKEIKAEYFDMLGIKSEDNGEDSSKDNEGNSPKIEESLKIKERPKTTPAARGSRIKSTQQSHRPNRVQSSWGERYRNDEYANIRSPYGLSEKQLEIKRRREEAIARRRKEEDERAAEEERRKREDAERAFQAWLSSKREEERERRKAVAEEDTEEDEMRSLESEKAFKAWKSAKKKQKHEEQEAATRRMEETASMYVVHDRGACEEAFTRWLKKKKKTKIAQELENKKKQLKQRPRRKHKEPLPINSDKIRFTDNYGYRNTVVH